MLLLVNGFGGTPLMELYLLVNAAHKVLAGAGVKVVRHLIGTYVTSLEMAGCSLTVSALDDAHARAVGRAGAHRRRCAGACSGAARWIGPTRRPGEQASAAHSVHRAAVHCTRISPVA